MNENEEETMVISGDELRKQADAALAEMQAAGEQAAGEQAAGDEADADGFEDVSLDDALFDDVSFDDVPFDDETSAQPEVAEVAEAEPVAEEDPFADASEEEDFDEGATMVVGEMSPDVQAALAGAPAVLGLEAPEPAAEPPVAEPVAEPVVEAAAPATQPKKKVKRKIDLKSRLKGVRGKAGRSTVKRSGDNSFPPPPPTGAVPAPKILSGAGVISALSPFAPAAPEKKVSAQAQTIKVEMGDEIIQERKKAGRKTLLFVALAAVLALLIGFFFGRMFQDYNRGKDAVAGAAKLAGEVDTANKKMADMSDVLRKAVEQLQQDEFPDELGEALKSMNVPFSAANFDGKGVGGLPSDTLGNLLRYNSGVEGLNKQKDKLRNLLTAAKPQVLKFIAQKEKPVVNFSVLFAREGTNIVVDLVPVKKPFEQKSKKWPATYEVIKPGKKPAPIEAVRFDGKMKLFGDKPVAVPVAEKTVSAFTSRKLVYSLRKALADTKALVDGKDSPVPSEQTNGLLKDGERLVEDLKKRGAAGG